jgi:hypothetical protein
MKINPFYVLPAMLLKNEHAGVSLSHACKQRGRSNALALMTRIDRLAFLN